MYCGAWALYTRVGGALAIRELTEDERAEVAREQDVVDVTLAIRAARDVREARPS